MTDTDADTKLAEALRKLADEYGMLKVAKIAMRQLNEAVDAIQPDDPPRNDT